MANATTTYTTEYIIKTLKSSKPLKDLEDRLSALENKAKKSEDSFRKLNKPVKDGDKILRDYAKAGSLVNQIVERYNISFKDARKIVSAYSSDVRKANEAAKDYSDTLRKNADEQRRLSDAQKKGAGLTASFSNSLKKLLIQFVGITAAIQIMRGVLRSAFGSIQELEDGLISVLKTTNLTGSELDSFRNQFRQIATQDAPIASAELLKFAAAAGQMGLRSAEDIALVTKVTAELARAVDGISGEDAAKEILSLTRLQGELIASTDNASNALVHLGNTTLSTEGPILELASFIGRTTARFEIGSKAVFAFSAFLAENKERAEAAGTVFGRVFNTLNKAAVTGENLEQLAKTAGLTAEEFRSLVRSDINQAFLKFLEGLSKKGKNAALVIEEIFGKSVRVDRVIGILASKFGRLNEVIDLANKGYTENKARSEEAERAFGTTSSRVQALANALGLLAENGFEPVSGRVKEIIDGLTEFVVGIIESDSASKQFIQTLLKLVTEVFAALIGILKLVADNLVEIGVLFTAINFQAVVAGIRAGLLSLEAVISTNLIVAVNALTAAILANPILAGSAVIIAAIFALNKAAESVSKTLGEQIGEISRNSEQLASISEKVASAIESRSERVIKATSDEVAALRDASQANLEAARLRLESLKKQKIEDASEFSESGFKVDPKLNREIEKAEDNISRLRQETLSYEVALKRMDAASADSEESTSDLGSEYENLQKKIDEAVKSLEALKKKGESRDERFKELEETRKQIEELNEAALEANERDIEIEIDTPRLSVDFFTDLDKLIEDLNKKVEVILSVELESGEVSFTREGAKQLSELRSSLASVAVDFDFISEKVKSLSRNLLETGLTIDEISDAITEVQSGDILSIAEDQAKRVGDERALKKITKERSELEQKLARFQFEAAVKLIELYGTIDAELQSIIDQTRELFDRPDKGSGGGPFDFSDAKDKLIEGAFIAGDALREAGKEAAANIVEGIGMIASGDFGGGVAAIGRGLGLGGGGASQFGGRKEGNLFEVGAELGGQFGPLGAIVGGIAGTFFKTGADDARVEFSGFGDAVIQEAQGGLKEVANDIANVMEDFFSTLSVLIGEKLDVAGSNLSISVREDIVTVAVNGIVKKFRDLDQALAFAAQQVLAANENVDGLGENMKRLFSNLGGIDVVGTLDELARATDLAKLADEGLGPSLAYITELRKEEMKIAQQFGLIQSDIIALTQQRIEAERKNIEQQALGFVGVSTGIQAYQDLIAGMEAFNDLADNERESREKRMEQILDEIDQLESSGKELGLESGKITRETIQGWRREAEESGVSWDEFTAKLSESERGAIRVAEKIDRLREEYEALAKSLGEIPEKFLKEFQNMLQEVARLKEQANLFQQIIDFQEQYGVRVADTDKLRRRMAELEFRLAQLRIQLLVIELAKNAELLGLSNSQINTFRKWAKEISDLDFSDVSPPGGGQRAGRPRRGEARESFADELARLEAAASGALPAILSYRQDVERITQLWRDAQLPAEDLARALGALAEIQVREVTQPFQRSIMEESSGSLEIFISDLSETVRNALDIISEVLGEGTEEFNDAADIIRRGAAAELSDAVRQTLISLGASSLGLAHDTELANRNIKFLLDNLDQLGITAEDVASAVREGVVPQLFDIAEAAARRSGDEQAAADIAARRHEMEVNFQRLEFEALVSMLEAAGAIDDELQQIIDDTRLIFSESDFGENPQSGIEALAELGSESARLELQTNRTIGQIQSLIDRMIDLGLTSEQIASAVREIAAPQILQIAEDQARRVGDEEAIERIQRQRAELELNLQRIQFEALVSMLEVANAITPALQQVIDDTRALFDMPTAGDTGGSENSLLSVANSLGAVSLQTQDSVRSIANAFRDLNQMVLDGVITFEEASAIIREAAQSNLSSFAGDLLSFVETYYGSVEEGESLKRTQLEINFAMERAQLEINFILIQQAYQMGLIAEEQFNSVLNAMQLVRSEIPDFSKLVSGSSAPSGGGGGGGGGGRSGGKSPADEMKKLREELDKLVEASEKSKLGPIAKQLDDIFSKFGRAGSILKTLSSSAEEFNKVASLLTDELRETFRSAFEPVDNFIERIEGRTRSPGENLTRAREEFESLIGNLPSDLSELDPDTINKIISAGEKFREAGVGVFGEGFGIGGIDRSLLDSLRQLQGLAPEEEDLLLMAVKFLTEQNKLSLEAVEEQSRLTGVAVREEQNENQNILNDILSGLGEGSPLSQRLIDVVAQLGLGSPIATNLLNLIDEIGAQPFFDILDAINSQDIDGVINTLVNGIGVENINFPSLFEILSQLGISDANLLNIANSLLGTLDVDSPEYAELSNIVSSLSGTLNVDNENFASLGLINEINENQSLIISRAEAIQQMIGTSIDRNTTQTSNIRGDIFNVQAAVNEALGIIQDLGIKFLESGGFISKPTFAMLHPGELVLNKDQTERFFNLRQSLSVIKDYKAESLGDRISSNIAASRSQVSTQQINSINVVSRLDTIIAKMNGNKIIDCLARIEKQLSRRNQFTYGGKIGTA